MNYSSMFTNGRINLERENYLHDNSKFEMGRDESSKSKAVNVI